VGVLFSENDHLVEPSVSRELALALAAQHVAVSADAGHWANKHAAEDIAAMLSRIMRSQQPQTPCGASPHRVH
jgi:predicted alpha/beta hydrolase family esterase